MMHGQKNIKLLQSACLSICPDYKKNIQKLWRVYLKF